MIPKNQKFPPINLASSQQHYQTPGSLQLISENYYNPVVSPTPKSLPYIHTFLYKIKRSLPTQQPHLYSHANLQKNLYRQRYQHTFRSAFCENFKFIRKLLDLQGLQVPIYTINLYLIISAIVTLILLILTCFEGFIDDFSQAESFHPAVITLKVICLVINLFGFVAKCICRFSHGENRIYMYQIVKAYFGNGRLVIDFFCIVFQILTLAFGKIMLISGLFFFFLILVFYRNLNDSIGLQITFINRQKNILVIQTLKIAMSNVVFGHVMASFLLAMSRINTQDNWLIAQGIENERWWIIYINAYYWGCTIMMTIGFGDILPVTPGEKLVTAFLELISCALLGYNISSIGNLISQIRQHRRRQNRRKVVFRRMIRSKGTQLHISKKLEIQILDYIRMTNQGAQNLEYLQRDQIVASLPQNLRKQYYKQLCPKIFPTVSFFNKISYGTLRVLAEKFVRKSYCPKQFLLDDVSQEILLLEKGKIGLGFKKKGSSLNAQIFETYEASPDKALVLITPYVFNLNQKFNYLLIAKQTALCWSLAYEDFIESLKQNQADYEYYFSVLHSHQLDNDFLNFKKCLRCSAEPAPPSPIVLTPQTKRYSFQKFHTIYDCPKLCFMPFRDMVMWKYARDYGKQQFRTKISAPSKPKASLAKKSALKHKHQLRRIAVNEQQFDFVVETFMQEKIFEYEIHAKKAKQKQSEMEQQLSSPQPYLSLPIEKNELKNLIYEQIKSYDLAYEEEEEFWFLECDKAYNYQFYFGNFSPYRVKKVKLDADANQDQGRARKGSEELGVEQRRGKRWTNLTKKNENSEKKMHWLTKIKSSIKDVL